MLLPFINNDTSCPITYRLLINGVELTSSPMNGVFWLSGTNFGVNSTDVAVEGVYDVWWEGTNGVWSTRHSSF